jgi:hypothetical protein
MAGCSPDMPYHAKDRLIIRRRPFDLKPCRRSETHPKRDRTMSGSSPLQRWMEWQTKAR